MTERRIAVSEVTTSEWSFEEDVRNYAAVDGVEGVAVWREKLDGVGAERAAELLDDHGLEAASLAFEGTFTDEETFERAVDDAESALHDAATLGAPVVHLFAGPRLGVSVSGGDERVRRALEHLAPTARETGVTLALEAVHPIEVMRRSTVVTLRQAGRLVDGIDVAGVTVDTWNTWWDPEVGPSIAEVRDDVVAVQIADWRADADDPRNRAPPGEGVVPLSNLVATVEATGYEGWYEVELFTDRYGPEEYESLVRDCVAGLRNVFP